MPVTPDLEAIRRVLAARLPGLAERYGVSSLALFGSRVRGDERPESDLDVLVRFERVPGLIRFCQLEGELSDLLGLRVDLVPAGSLKPAVERRVAADLVPV